MISPHHSHCPKELSGDQDYVSHPRVQQPRKVRFETSHHPTCTLQCSKCSPEALSPVLIQKRQPPVAERLTDEMRIKILATPYSESLFERLRTRSSSGTQHVQHSYPDYIVKTILDNFALLRTSRMHSSCRSSRCSVVCSHGITPRIRASTCQSRS